MTAPGHLIHMLMRGVCCHCTECMTWFKSSHSPTCDLACESCGRRGREMVTACFSDGSTFAVCSSCGQDAAEHGCEVTS